MLQIRLSVYYCCANDDLNAVYAGNVLQFIATESYNKQEQESIYSYMYSVHRTRLLDLTALIV